MRIFLVEDSAIARELLGQWFALLEGAEIVHVARTSAEALGWLQQHPQGWDLVVIDLFLAGGHGFEVLRHCRDRAPHQRAVLLTSYTRDPVRENARRAGADAVFDKGVEMKDLLAWCRRYQGEFAG